MLTFDAFYSGHYDVTESDHAVPLKTASPPAALAGTAVRRLTPVECERLMGWPDDHTAGVPDSHRYRMCGNGVAAPVAEWIGHQLAAVLAPTVDLHIHGYQLHREGVSLPVWRSDAWLAGPCKEQP